MRRVAQYNSPIGPLLLAAEGDFLTEVRFPVSYTHLTLPTTATV